MFSGEYQHTIDAKGRIIMPVKFREALGDSFVVTKGLDHNLLVFSNEEWQSFYEKLSTLPLSNKNSRGFSRLFLAGAIECETDKQGRILITQPLKEYASLVKDVTVIGNGNKLEIWSTENWNDYINSIDTDEIADSLCELGIMI
ncbi:MAG: division/cell wall cluster transcriptional repressor MraZ [Ruminococcaceae bacterium]|nr:division/cell wall cluster transcriptional repressor MraZ [Oscillospiraceae bacterium]